MGCDLIDSSPRAYLKFISDLSVSSQAFTSKITGRGIFDDLDKRPSEFRTLIWTAIEKKGHRKSEILKQLKKIKLYAGEDQILTEAHAPCLLDKTEQMILIDELI